MEQQIRRYFVALVTFGFIAVAAQAGLLDAVLAIAACAAVVSLPRLRTRRADPQRSRATLRRRPTARTRPAPKRPDAALVPDEPSLILEYAQYSAESV